MLLLNPLTWLFFHLYLMLKKLFFCYLNPASIYHSDLDLHTASLKNHTIYILYCLVYKALSLNEIYLSAHHKYNIPDRYYPK